MGNSITGHKSWRGAPPEKTTVFKQDEPPGITYRIPSLIYIKKNQTFLAFAEKRTSSSDHDAKLLVIRRGTLDSTNIKVTYCIFTLYSVLNSFLLPCILFSGLL